MSDAERLSRLRHDLSNPLSALLAETQLLLMNESEIDPTHGDGAQGDRGTGDPDADDAARALTPLSRYAARSPRLAALAPRRAPTP